MTRALHEPFGGIHRLGPAVMPTQSDPGLRRSGKFQLRMLDPRYGVCSYVFCVLVCFFSFLFFFCFSFLSAANKARGSVAAQSPSQSLNILIIASAPDFFDGPMSPRHWHGVSEI